MSKNEDKSTMATVEGKKDATYMVNHLFNRLNKEMDENNLKPPKKFDPKLRFGTDPVERKKIIERDRERYFALITK